MDEKGGGGGQKAPAFLKHTGKVSGYFTIAGPLLLGQVAEGETLQCVHCQHTWQIRPGSGSERGWCQNCSGPTCGFEPCFVCVPWERKMEIAEGRDPLKTTFKGAYIL
jgi:hypothetical protein